MSALRMVATAAVAVAAGGLLGSGCSDSDGAIRNPAPTEPATATTVIPRKTTLRAQLSGRAVVPGPGALSGRGKATVTLDAADAEVCFELEVSAIDPAITAAIVTGPAGAIGPSLVALTPPSDGQSEGCVGAERGLIESILLNPGGFYVSITNVQFPGGALRGQLAQV